MEIKWTGKPGVFVVVSKGAVLYGPATITACADALRKLLSGQSLA